MKLKYLLFSLLLTSFSLSMASCYQKDPVSDAPKNIIFLIGDGMGYNHVDATSAFLHGEFGKLVFEGDEWLKVAQATYPAVMQNKPELIYAAGYNPRAAWSDTAYLKRDYTDSGAAGTALSTGYKTYRGSIGLGVNGDTLEHISQLAREFGKSAGIITSVQLSHATPAAFTAHNEDRRNYPQIARQMILEAKLDVLMGCGHPEFDNNAGPMDPDYKYVGGRELWQQLNHPDQPVDYILDGKEYTLPDLDGDGSPDAWTLVIDSADFAAVAMGRALPKRLLGIPRAHTTLQQSRAGLEYLKPREQNMTPGLPSLEQMTMAAVNVLNQNSDGFFLMVEGGAIDWAAHDNHPGRMIEEMNDFVNSVAAVVDWVETYSSWDETLVVVTSDHETGMLWGPADKIAVLKPVINNGKGVLPGMQWHSDDHTNALVPVYVRGKGSEMYQLLADEVDPVKGPFVQNTDIAKAIFLLWGR
jgi:alkaline phosphatase